MVRQTRKYLLFLLAALLVAYLVYKFKNSAGMQSFHWDLVVESLRRARLSLVVLSVAAIFVCYALRALRWMRFSRTLG